MDYLSRLFDPTGFVPRRDCGDWSSGLVLLHNISDGLIWMAYMAIPFFLVYLIRRRRDIPFPWVFWLFGTFIISCGCTHLLDVILFYWPIYRLSGLLKLLTALASWGTVFALIPMIPKALALRSPAQLEPEVAARTAELAQANAELLREVAERKLAERTLAEERERFRLTLASIGDGVIATDREGRVTFINPVACSLTGLSKEEALGKNLEEVFRVFEETSRRPVESPAVLALREGTAVALSNSTVLAARGGSDRPIENCAAPICSDDGVVGAVLVFRDVTERRRAQEARGRLAAIVESSEDSIIGESLDGLITSWNQGAERLFGYTAAEAVGRPVSMLAPEGKPCEMMGILDRVRRGERVEPFETVRLRKDGTLVDISLSVSPVKDAHGRVVGAAKISRDITKKKRAEADQALLVAIVQSADEAIISADPDGVIRSWNPAAERLFGHTPEEAIGKSNFDLIVPPDRLAESRQRVERVRQGEHLSPLETIRLRKGGKAVHVSVSVSAVHIEGRVVGLSAIYQDITERKAAEAAREKAEEALRLRDRAIKAVTQGILITDPSLPDNPIIFAGPGIERLTGYQQSEILGRNCRFLQGPHTDADTVSTMRRAIREGRPCTVEILNYRKDGTPFWNALSLSPVHDSEGRLTHFVGIQTDVSERRRLEEQYRQRQKMEVVGQLAGGVAHDFNNLLCIITGYGELLLGRLAANDPAREMIEQMTRAGERAAGLTRQLLAFSRGAVLAPQVLDLNAVVGDLEKMLRRTIGEDVSLEISLQPGLGRVKADPGQVEQVLLNLSINARDAMPTGGKLTIQTRDAELNEEFARTHPEVRPGRHILLMVSDTGQGMTAEVKARIFEPFFTTKEKGRGTGLGLATVHGIIKQSGGHIVVDSEVGRGTVFNIYFPRVEERPSRSRSHQWVRSSLRGNETVLLVEDEDAVRALARLALAGSGYNVLEASNGSAALQIVASHQGPIHLLVSDVVMPGLGGPELAERLLALHPQMKVLFLSGYTDDAVIRYGILHEQVNFLQKPYTTAALTQKVREVLDSPSVGD